jgi:putative DNA primase/helicase
MDLSAAIVLGEPCPVMALGRDEAETEKRLGACLLDAQPLISIDNVNGELSGDFLCQAIERPVVSIRILGRSERIKIEARASTFFATGNNVTLVGDLVRRAIVATLDPRMERPELRKFAGDPVATVLANRGAYIAAALTIARAYLAAGKPDRLPPLASFEGWSDIVRSALVWLGLADPVATMETARAEDPELIALGELLSAWSAAFGSEWRNRRTVPDALHAIEERTVTTGGECHDPYERAHQYPQLREAIVAISPRGKPDARSLGRWLRRNKGRIVGGLRFDGRGGEQGRSVEWWASEA